MSYHCMTKMKNRLLVLILIQLLNKMHSLDAFTNPCNSSVQTVKTVETCPTSGSSYKKAAKEKNCSSLAGKALECQSFEYHCVLSDDRKYAIEVCAPSINIVGNVCAKFSTNLRSIIRIDDFDCTKCPYSYNSTTAFECPSCDAECYAWLRKKKEKLYLQSYAMFVFQNGNVSTNGKDTQCYANITLPFTTGSSQNSTVMTTSKENDAVIFDGVSTSKPNDEDMNMDPENKQHGVIAALGSTIGTMFICIVLILKWRKIRERASKCIEVPDIFNQNEESSLPLTSKTLTENDQGLIRNGSHATTNSRPLSQNQHASTKHSFVENKLYNNHDSGVKFAKLTTTLADKFPHQKLQSLKLMLQASGKVANVKRLKETELVSECFSLLLDENLYSQYDVVFMQFLCKEMCCTELYTECITYAFEHKALCFYEKTTGNCIS